MIISVDIETRGLDATQLIIGALQKEGKSKTEYYYNKTDLWNRIKELAQKEQKRGKILNVYSHNASYDFYGYAPLNDPNIKWFCHKPFIVAYTQPTTNQQITTNSTKTTTP